MKPKIHYGSEVYIGLYIYIFNLKGCGTVLKVALPAAARKTLPTVAAKLESIAQCGTVPVPPITGPSKISKSLLIRGTAQHLEKNERRDSVRKKRGPNELSQLPTLLTALTDQFREGKAYLHLKLNPAKQYKQDVSLNYTHSVMET